MGYIRWVVFISIPLSIPTPKGLLGNQPDAETAILPDRSDKPYLFKNRIYSMIGITAFGLLALSLPDFASTDTPATSSPLGGLVSCHTAHMVCLCEPQEKRNRRLAALLLYSAICRGNYSSDADSPFL
jgi:hypothetical protein